MISSPSSASNTTVLPLTVPFSDSILSKFASDTVILTSSAVTSSPEAIVLSSPSTSTSLITGASASNIMPLISGTTDAKDTSLVRAPFLYSKDILYDADSTSSSVTISEPEYSDPLLLDFIL